MKKILLLTALFVAASTAFAGQMKDGPHIGSVLSGDTREENTIYGWQVAYEMDNDIISWELVGTRQEDSLSPPDALPDMFESDFDMWVLSLSAAVRAGYTFFDKVHVYGSIGYAYYYFDADAENVRVAIDAAESDGDTRYNAGVDVDDALGVVVAGGIEVRISEAWEIIAEYRVVSLETEMNFDFTTITPAPEGFGMATSDSQVTYSEDVSYDHHSFRVGVNFKF